MRHLYICTLFSYQTETLNADTFIVCRIAESVEEAKSGLDGKNLEIHPAPEWTGHYVSAAQCGDELVKQASQEIYLTSPFPSEMNPSGIIEDNVPLPSTMPDPYQAAMTPVVETPLGSATDKNGDPFVAFPPGKRLWDRFIS